VTGVQTCALPIWGADSSFTSFIVDYWTITASSGAGGSIAPAGVIEVAEGAASAFTVTPGAGWQVGDLLVDGVSAGAIGDYQFNAVAAHHTIAASFLDVAAPVVAVTSPAGGDDWGPGSVHDITWTATDNLGVDSVTIEYSVAGLAGPWTVIAHGIENSGTYAWTVPLVGADSARVRVTAFDAGLNTGTGISTGTFRIRSDSVAAGGGGELSLSLASPMPNPTNGAAWLRFTLPQEADALLEILDLAGRRIWYAGGRISAGEHTWRWDGNTAVGSRAGAGLYFVRLTTPSGTRISRLSRLR
jgi:hypothetical protein